MSKKNPESEPSTSRKRPRDEEAESSFGNDDRKSSSLSLGRTNCAFSRFSFSLPIYNCRGF